MTPDVGRGPDNKPDDAELHKVVRYLSQESRVPVIVEAIRTALDEVIATSRTRRWQLDQCNNQEKAYVGVNLENLIRSGLGLQPHRPRRPDFVIDGVEVDCKWSRNWNGWMIPREAVGHICLLVYGDDLADEAAIGLIRIEDGLLVKGNQDKKRSLKSPEGTLRVTSLLPRSAQLPPNFLMSLRKDDRDAILSPRGGDDRLRELFRRCEGMLITRHTVQSVGQQLDAGRRARGDTIKVLSDEGIEVLNGTRIAKRQRAAELGWQGRLGSDEWVSLRTDGSTPERLAELEPIRLAEAKRYRQLMIKERGQLRKSERKLREKEMQLLSEIEEEQAAFDATAFDAVTRAESVAAVAASRLASERANG